MSLHQVSFSLMSSGSCGGDGGGPNKSPDRPLKHNGYFVHQLFKYFCFHLYQKGQSHKMSAAALGMVSSMNLLYGLSLFLRRDSFILDIPPQSNVISKPL